MRLFKKLSALWEPFSQPQIQIYASAAGFHLMISALPAIALFLSLLPYFPLTQDLWRTLLENTLPQPLRPLFFTLLQQIYGSGSPAVISLSAILTLWSASKGILAVMDGMNAAMSLNRLEGYIRRRIFAVLYFLILTASLLLMLLSLVFGNVLFALTQTILRTDGTYLLLFHLRGAASLVLLSALFCCMYRLLPSQKFPWRCCLLGAVVTALGWILLSAVFSFYIDHISNFRELYGSIGLLVLSGLWLRTCVTALLFGGVFVKLQASGRYHPIQIIKSAFRP